MLVQASRSSDAGSRGSKQVGLEREREKERETKEWEGRGGERERVGEREGSDKKKRKEKKERDRGLCHPANKIKRRKRESLTPVSVIMFHL